MNNNTQGWILYNLYHYIFVEFYLLHGFMTDSNLIISISSRFFENQPNEIKKGPFGDNFIKNPATVVYVTWAQHYLTYL